MLRELNIQEDVDETLLEKQLRRIEANHDVILDERQREAVKEAVRWGVLVITGGPGTGKTTTINAIIRYFEGEGQDIFLAAPTGRAAKRMTEATGYEARTIHRPVSYTHLDVYKRQPFYILAETHFTFTENGWGRSNVVHFSSCFALLVARCFG